MNFSNLKRGIRIGISLIIMAGISTAIMAITPTTTAKYYDYYYGHSYYDPSGGLDRRGHTDSRPGSVAPQRPTEENRRGRMASRLQ